MVVTELLTIGHSTRSLDEFAGLLAVWRVALLVDVRTVPRSRRNPQFNEDVLSSELAARGIAYERTKALGGWRRPVPDSPNTGWRLASFRGYADYMRTGEFERALNALIASARQRRLAIMCAEAVPWRCHRSLIADALLVRGCEVRHIMTATKAEPHRMTPFARVDGDRVTYPPVT